MKRKIQTCLEQFFYQPKRFKCNIVQPFLLENYYGDVLKNATHRWRIPQFMDTVELKQSEESDQTLVSVPLLRLLIKKHTRLEPCTKVVEYKEKYSYPKYLMNYMLSTYDIGDNHVLIFDGPAMNTTHQIIDKGVPDDKIIIVEYSLDNYQRMLQIVSNNRWNVSLIYGDVKDLKIKKTIGAFYLDSTANVNLLRRVSDIFNNLTVADSLYVQFTYANRFRLLKQMSYRRDGKKIICSSANLFDKMMAYQITECLPYRNLETEQQFRIMYQRPDGGQSMSTSCWWFSSTDDDYGSDLKYM